MKYNFDYSGNAAYFITICTKNRVDYFGSIGVRHRLALNECGKIVKQCLKKIPIIYTNIILDEFIIMPNHIHAIIIMNNDTQIGRADVSPLKHHSQMKTIGYIIGQFKSSATKIILANNISGFAWQRNYFERIITSDAALHKIRQYIKNNPANWHLSPPAPYQPGKSS